MKKEDKKNSNKTWSMKQYKLNWTSLLTTVLLKTSLPILILMPNKLATLFLKTADNLAKLMFSSLETVLTETDSVKPAATSILELFTELKEQVAKMNVLASYSMLKKILESKLLLMLLMLEFLEWQN